MRREPAAICSQIDAATSACFSMILEAVAVRAVHHHALAQPLGGQARADLGDVLGVVVRAGARAAAQDHVAGVVADGLEDRRHALLGDRRKPVRRPRGQHGVDGDLRAAVGAVLEADRHRQPRRQLAVHLALRGARADRDPRGQVGDVLRDLGVEKLRSGRQPEIVDVEQQLAREAQPLVDVEALVEIGIVDQPLPADRPSAASRSRSASRRSGCPPADRRSA